MTKFKCTSLCIIWLALFSLVFGGTLFDRNSINFKDQYMHDDAISIQRHISVQNSDELTNLFWLDNARNFVQNQLTRKEIKNKAKNIILFLGDGMSVPTLAASRMYMGGEEKYLSFEKFPYLGMSKTYCVDHQIAESACTATAYLSGVKANYRTIGLSPNVQKGDCTAGLLKENRVTSIAKWALDAGKDAGLVTTTNVADASPTGVYAHVAHRDWKNNQEVLKMNCDDKLVDDIAEQLVYGDVGSKLKVILGGGRREFLDRSMKDEENHSGERTDKKNLINEWLNLKIDNGKRNYVWNKVLLY